jgi:aspartyl-tRNA(Asn)/glutamyl-tRNA(Gln) amidotransferase subunit A
MLSEKLKQIKSGKLTAVDNIKHFLSKIEKEDKKINSILHINKNAIEQAKEVDLKIKSDKSGKLAGLGFVVKSNINVLGMICNCASKTIENYKATYNATVIEKLLKEDAIILGMANMDEFALGASGETSAFGLTRNPKVLDRIPGGTSSGCAAAVASGFSDFAIGSDTGGSIRNPASHCGIVGLRPSYGAVSRYGLIDSAMSFDTIGTLANSVDDCELVFSLIKGKDDNDSVTREYPVEKKDSKNIKLGILKVGATKEIWNLILKKVDEVCKKNNWSKENLTLDYVD